MASFANRSQSPAGAAGGQLHDIANAPHVLFANVACSLSADIRCRRVSVAALTRCRRPIPLLAVRMRKPERTESRTAKQRQSRTKRLKGGPPGVVDFDVLPEALTPSPSPDRKFPKKQTTFFVLKLSFLRFTCAQGRHAQCALAVGRPAVASQGPDWMADCDARDSGQSHRAPGGGRGLDGLSKPARADSQRLFCARLRALGIERGLFA
ncbi:hypothetical protein [Pandoravirus japonicus]|uniref:Uncharacterized protein n=1 Tax=Pandoravirus japonicus TaxID=2823154 RepID=A0A811BRT7_9VIRU|nr:hypothetical protein [Pandoravirus japonicus]